jgi:hypothetical protein
MLPRMWHMAIPRMPEMSFESFKVSLASSFYPRSTRCGMLIVSTLVLGFLCGKCRKVIVPGPEIRKWQINVGTFRECIQGLFDKCQLCGTLLRSLGFTESVLVKWGPYRYDNILSLHGAEYYSHAVCGIVDPYKECSAELGLLTEVIPTARQHGAISAW